LGFGFRGCAEGLGLGVFAGLVGEVCSSLLFDNYIGRKRDVGGGVLAGLCCLGWFSRERGAAWTMGSEETTDGHVSKFIALEPMERARTS
jgi:hypothetical protein